MTLQEKLRIIQNLSGLTQTEMATKIGVSFVAFNNWWTGKATPRKKQEALIDTLYKEYTGQKEIPENVLIAKKDILRKKSEETKNILTTILENPDIFDQFLLSLTYNSNKIEGSTLSEDETAAILFQNKSIPDKSIIEQLEVKNHQAALHALFSFLQEKKKMEENTLLRIHGILMNGIRNDAGTYRRHGVRIVGSNVPTANHLKIPALMTRLVQKIQTKNTDPLGHAATIHAQFEKIHPFSDGNGRVGRMLLVAMLLRKNFAPAIVRQEEKQLYYACLRRAQLKDDTTQLEDFLCDAVSLGFALLERK